MKNSISIRSIGLAAAIVALTASGAARADETISATRIVSTQGLDLTSPDGQAKLRKQINKAARQVCVQVTNGLNPGDVDFQDCVRQAFVDAWAQAESKIASAKNRPLLASATPKSGG